MQLNWVMTLLLLEPGIFFILLHHAASIYAEVYFDTGSGKQWKLMNVTKIAIEKGQDYCTSLTGLYDLRERM